MQRAMDETQRRREKQHANNEAEGIVPKTITKSVQDIMDGAGVVAGRGKAGKRGRKETAGGKGGVGSTGLEQDVVQETLSPLALAKKLNALEKEMLASAQALEFEKAAHLRDEINALKAAHFLALPE
jgi:excinuclease ABC subunit B